MAFAISMASSRVFFGNVHGGVLSGLPGMRLLALVAARLAVVPEIPSGLGSLLLVSAIESTVFSSAGKVQSVLSDRRQMLHFALDVFLLWYSLGSKAVIHKSSTRERRGIDPPNRIAAI